MPLPLWENIALFGAFMYGVAPIIVRATFQYSVKCQPQKVDPATLPAQVRAIIDRWSRQIQATGFTEVGTYDLGIMASNTHSFIAYFVNRSAGDFANVSVVLSAKGAQGYFEFSSSFTNGLTLDTNVNKIISATATPADILIFRFPKVASPVELYPIHRALIQKHAAFLRPQLPPEGEEATRIEKQIGRFAPVQVDAGYMSLAPGGTHYCLTWKGAFLMTWKLLWPTSLIRKALYRMEMDKVLRSLHSGGLIGSVRTI